MIKITKFGGSSVADAEQFKKVKAIIEADPSRRFVVSSASGKRFKGDNKITDLLYLCQAHVTYHVDYLPLFNMIADRFRSIRDELGLKVDIETDLAKMRDSLPEMSVDEIVSRGEYFTSRLMADYLGFPFVDATDVVCINFDGTFNFNETTERLKEILKKHDRFVMPGFYGRLPDGHVRVMSRGGSDISGSILARCIQADLYENWTDVSGFLMADPRIVENPRNIEQITFSELRELSYMGASVLHEDAVFPLRERNIPIHQPPAGSGHDRARQDPRRPDGSARHRHCRQEGLRLHRNLEEEHVQPRWLRARGALHPRVLQRLGRASAFRHRQPRPT